MIKKKSSLYSNAYKVGLTIFVILVIIVSLILVSVIKNISKTETVKTEEIIGEIEIQLDTVYLPNPNPKVIHDTVYKMVTCNKKHIDVVKTTKDTTK